MPRHFINVSQNYDYLGRLEELNEDISFYFKEWLENEFNPKKSRPDEIRYRFSLYQFYKIAFIDLNQEEYKKEYNNALEKYDSLFPCRDIFNRE